jgi:hypothetical protein
VATSTVQRDGKVAAGNHGGARDALGPEHPKDVQRRRPVDEYAAFVGGGRPEHTHLLLKIYHHVLPLRRRAHDATVAGTKPRVRHDCGDLIEKLSVAFHFAKPTP